MLLTALDLVDPSSFAKPCIYCQFDALHDDETEAPLVEARFVPAECELERIFAVLSECALLNPDEDSAHLAVPVESPLLTY